jgi:hypothetical protein
LGNASVLAQARLGLPAAPLESLAAPVCSVAGGYEFG